jgi:hypothetical protein
MVLLTSAMCHGLSVRRRQALTEALGVSPQTLWRWRRWWQETFPDSRCWHAERGMFVPPIQPNRLPGALLERFTTKSLVMRTCQVLRLVAATTTTSWTGFSRVAIDPQKM